MAARFTVSDILPEFDSIICAVLFLFIIGHLLLFLFCCNLCSLALINIVNNVIGTNTVTDIHDQVLRLIFGSMARNHNAMLSKVVGSTGAPITLWSLENM